MSYVSALLTCQGWFYADPVPCPLVRTSAQGRDGEDVENWEQPSTSPLFLGEPVPYLSQAQTPYPHISVCYLRLIVEVKCQPLHLY